MVDISFHKSQVQVYQDEHKFRVSVNGRRWGKSRLVTYELMLAALGFKGEYDPVSPQVVLGVMPTAIQARKILWEPLVHLATSVFKEYVKSINRTEMVITFRGALPAIRIVGANDNNGDRLRGLRIYFVCLDEMQNINASVFDNIIVPAMADTPDSRALITGTPLGKTNILYYLFKRAETMQDWVSFNFPTASNPFVDRAEIERARLALVPREFRQEFEASFESFAGRVYTELDTPNLCYSSPAVFDHYIMGVDFGDVNPAVVVFGVCRHDGVETYYYVNGWTNTTNKAVPTFQFNEVVSRLQSKYRCVAAYCDPSRPSAILELRKIVPAIAGYNRIDEGLSQVHNLVFQKRLMFLTETERIPGLEMVSGVQAYEEMYTYHYETAKDGTVTGKIADGQVDHCLVGDTLVLTDTGEKYIRDISLADKVLTREGYKALMFAGLTCGSTEVYQVLFNDGTTLRGTAKHPILVGEAWTHIDMLCYNDEVSTLEQNSWLSPSSSTASSTEAIQSILSPQCVTTIAPQGTKPLDICIKRFGCTQTEQYQKGITSIIKTAILIIMTFLTLSVSALKSIWQSIMMSVLRVVKQWLSQGIWSASDISLKNGTHQKKVENGIQRTGMMLGTLEHRNSTLVNNAVPSLNLKPLYSLDSALTNVKPSIGDYPALMMLTERVCTVLASSGLINTQSRHVVAKRVVSVTKLPDKQPVYNLEVEDAPEFYANGILVHNCTDATRYALSRKKPK